jgi:hypothetical protein
MPAKHAADGFASGGRVEVHVVQKTRSLEFNELVADGVSNEFGD